MNTLLEALYIIICGILLLCATYWLGLNRGIKRATQVYENAHPKYETKVIALENGKIRLVTLKHHREIDEATARAEVMEHVPNAEELIFVQ